MTHGKEVEARYTVGESKGYPWFVILDAEGKALADADGPQGNIGCPVSKEEADHLFRVLGETRIRLTDADLAVLRAEHSAFAAPILEATRRR